MKIDSDNKIYRNFIKLRTIISIQNGFRLFKYGLLILPSFPLIGAILLFISSIIGSQKRSDSYLNDTYNLPFLLIAVLMLLSCISQMFIPVDDIYSKWDYKLSFLSLLNWFPFFWCFWSFKNYLINSENRKQCSLCITIGTIPLIISTVCQYWFKLYGPFVFLNNLIVWFQRPICSGDFVEECVTGVTGFFNNPNIAGSYFTLIIPFSIALVFVKFGIKAKSKYLYGFILISLIFFTILTNSRNAWIGMLISFTLLFNKFWLSTIFLFFTSFLLFSLFLNRYEIISSDIIDRFINLIPYTLKSKIDNFSLSNLGSMPRISFYKIGLFMILTKPIFGWGASTYPIFFLNKNNFYSAHSHNLFLELAINYGIPISIIFLIYLIYLLHKSIKIINLNKNRSTQIIDKAWFTAIIVFISTHLFDIQYYDSRISITFWIILSGLRAIIAENQGKLFNKDII